MTKMRFGIVILMMMILATVSVSAVTFVGDNAVVSGGNQTDNLLIQDSTNVTFTGVNFLGNVTVNNSNQVTLNDSRFLGDTLSEVGSSGVTAPNSFFGSIYAPLHASDENSGCPDGDGVVVSGNVTVTPWFRSADKTDPSGNCNPVLDPIADQDGNLGYEFSLTANCSDPNALDSLIFTDNSSVINISVGGVITYTPEDPINESILITCSDSEYVDTEEFRFTVEPGSGYVPVFTGSAISDVSVDFVGSLLVALLGLAAVIGMGLTYMFLSGKRPGFLKRFNL